MILSACYGQGQEVHGMLHVSSCPLNLNIAFPNHSYYRIIGPSYFHWLPKPTNSSHWYDESSYYRRFYNLCYYPGHLLLPKPANSSYWYDESCIIHCDKLEVIAIGLQHPVSRLQLSALLRARAWDQVMDEHARMVMGGTYLQAEGCVLVRRQLNQLSVGGICATRKDNSLIRLLWNLD